MVEISPAVDKAQLLTENEAIKQSDVILKREVFPTARFYTDEELAHVLQILPNYEAPVPEELPQVIHPVTFEGLKSYTAELQAGRVTLERDEETLETYRSHQQALKGLETKPIDYLQADLMKGNAYALVHERFNHGPEITDMTHNVLWMSSDDHVPQEIGVMILDALRTLNKTPDDVVIVEKLRAARTETGNHIPGITPTVPGLRHLHLYTRN